MVEISSQGILRNEIDRLQQLFDELEGLFAVKCDAYEGPDQYAQRSVNSALERKREAIIDHVLSMGLPYDQELAYFRTIGVGMQLPSEREWLDTLGLGPGARIGYGEGVRRQQDIESAGMFFNKKLGPDVKPYAWYVAEGDVRVVGVTSFARDGLMRGVRVVRRSNEIVSTTNDRTQS